jgi:hypothetical protein
MSARLSTVFLWLFIINLGIAFGAGLYEGRIVVPQWITSAPEDGAQHWHPDRARTDDTGLRFWAFVTTGPLTLLTLANLIAGWKSTATVRRWWLGAAGVSLAERVFTLAYFVPTMVGLMGSPDSAEAVSIANRWAALNNVRHVMVLAAWLAALKTLSLLYQARGSTAGA